VSSLWTKLFGQASDPTDTEKLLQAVNDNVKSSMESWIHDLSSITIPQTCFVWCLVKYGLWHGMLLNNKFSGLNQSMHAEIAWNSFKSCEKFIRSTSLFDLVQEELLKIEGHAAPTLSLEKELQDCFYESLATASHFVDRLRMDGEKQGYSKITVDFFFENEAVARMICDSRLTLAIAAQVSASIYIKALGIGRQIA
jgi:hypothetical protein